MIFIGIDNGVSGAVACLHGDLAMLIPMPVFETFSYQKKAKRIHRVAFRELGTALQFFAHAEPAEPVHIYLERPMVMPARFDATVSALRAYEATLITLEVHLPNASVKTVDSRDWQKPYLPEGIKGPDLKKASLQRGIERWPQLADPIRRQKDADALFIAELCRKEHS